ncbi:MAG: chromate transporter [Gudongella sp.]|nr:chromate transporter [Gudongella sp.]
MIFAKLFYEFLKIGFFTIGGGMATIPFLQELSESTGWYSIAFIADMVAISESTPGPIGINMATYVGYNVAGILGGVIATLGLVIPSIIIVSVVSGYLERFRKSALVENVFYGLRPAVTGLIAAAGVEIVRIAVLDTELYKTTNEMGDLLDWRKALYFVIIFYLIRRFKKHPVAYIALSAMIGIAFGFAN